MFAPLKVFCCYARKDQEMLEQLKKHLTFFERRGLIKIWSDTNLNAGIEWETELHKHLESADLILLLISSDFMASDYCYGNEMKRALERHEQKSAHVIPILLRSTYWHDAPFAKLQMIPTDTKPVTEWLDRDGAWYDITRWIKQIIDKLYDQAQKEVKDNSESYVVWQPEPALAQDPLLALASANPSLQPTISSLTSLATQEFSHQEQGYLDWIHTHPHGFVINTEQSKNPSYMVLHRASCRTMSHYSKNATLGGFTERGYMKICASDLSSLRNWVRQHGRVDGTFSAEHKCYE